MHYKSTCEPEKKEAKDAISQIHVNPQAQEGKKPSKLCLTSKIAIVKKEKEEEGKRREKKK